MRGISLAAVTALIPIIGSEFALGGAKLQTRLPRALVAWMAGYVAAVLLIVRNADSGLVAFTIFWAGAFLLWFGARSHIESSILLRMLFLLRQRPMTDTGLVDAYTAHAGQSMRVADLCRAGLIVKHCDQMRVTAKGKAILLVVSKLR